MHSRTCHHTRTQVVHALLGGVIVMAWLCIAEKGSTQPLNDKRSQAATAYNDAQRAALAQEYDTAAELFEEADSLVPAPQSLRSALKLRTLTGDIRQALEHAEELLRRYPYDVKSRALAVETIDRLSPSLVRVMAVCSFECRIIARGRGRDSKPGRRHVFYIVPGRRRLIARFADGRRISTWIRQEAGEHISLTFDPPAPIEEPTGSEGNAPETTASTATSGQGGETVAGTAMTDREAGSRASDGGEAALEQDAGVTLTVNEGDSSGPRLVVGDRGLRAPTDDANIRLPRLPLVIGGLTTAALGAATIWSHDNTVSAEQDPGASQDTIDGRRLRTRILLGGTALSGVATLVIAVVGAERGGARVSESAEPSRPMALGMSVGPHGYWLAMKGKF